jgi:hypothetical protein
MQRMIAVLVLVGATLFAAQPADAFWHHWGRCGWGGYRGWGGYGYRGIGWGGYGYRGYGWGYPGYGYGGGYGGFGYGGYGYPYYSVGYSPWYGCANCGGYGYGTTVGLGYPAYGMYAGSYAPPVNIVVMPRPAAAPAAAPVAPAAVAKPVATAVAALKNPATAAALQRFLGLKDAPPPTLVSAAPAKSLADVLSRLSSVESRRKAERLMTEGDELFHAQNYHSALQKYKLAASTAPDYVEALWRQAHALVATHNYELATAAFKRAIARTEDLGRGGFRLNDIYAGAQMTKTQHLESLAEWAMNRSNSPDPYFLLGLFLNYDGQTARAEKFFQKASDLAGISGGHIAVFLAPAEEAPRPRTERAIRPTVSVPIAPISIGTDL